MVEEKEAQYYSKDFQWEELREEVERDPSLRHHLAPFPSSSPHPSNVDAWRRFHQRHSTGRFFKERRYLLKEFPELVYCDDFTNLLEVGCGNGSTVLPILRAKQNILVHACDCSEEVLEKAKEILATANVRSHEHRFHPFLLDFSVSGFPNWLFCASCQKTSLAKPLNLPSDFKENESTRLNDLSFLREDRCCIGGVDFITLIFTLSAVPFQKMSFVADNCFSVLKPGGLLFFRDYGLYDMTMLRFLPEQRMGCNEYMRSDGTLSYFFSLDTVKDLFLGAGFIELELEYCCVRSVNRRNGKKMQRVWVHGKFQKPIPTSF
uniref:tRNA N(3)-methylcytidine methyltransferase n=1 Tax=Elaeis guineensis var. tenera TaxID=51953 RepID=A0A6J0PJ75_ELAGV|nr:methyltransferase-like protein 6 isoform X1 [Elaeis guineensis]XP_010918770.1 methyltransferase-like protein 6 isoform X1 [Elaeis guineensis]XP_019705639.1 methyltransferase-like protein 6 isoform X1 [Elaeis guineensis]